MRFRSLQIRGCEPLFEAVVYRGKQRAGLLALTLRLPKAGEAGSAAPKIESLVRGPTEAVLKMPFSGHGGARLI